LFYCSAPCKGTRIGPRWAKNKSLSLPERFGSATASVDHRAPRVQN
jgi:hypothetical protein